MTTPAEASPLIAAQHANEQKVMQAGFEPAFDGPPGVPLMWKRGRSLMEFTEAVALASAEQAIPTKEQK